MCYAFLMAYDDSLDIKTIPVFCGPIDGHARGFEFVSYHNGILVGNIRGYGGISNAHITELSCDDWDVLCSLLGKVEYSLSLDYLDMVFAPDIAKRICDIDIRGKAAVNHRKNNHGSLRVSLDYSYRIFRNLPDLARPLFFVTPDTQRGIEQLYRANMESGKNAVTAVHEFTSAVNDGHKPAFVNTCDNVINAALLGDDNNIISSGERAKNTLRHRFAMYTEILGMTTPVQRNQL